jgi:ABC-type uncharacterized transport system substrate-binding protein
MTAGADEKIQRIGILEMAAPDSERLALWEIFKRRLHDLGHTEGTGIELQFRWAEGHTERLAAGAAELIALLADVLVTAGTPAAAAASCATSTIPIVMATGVGLGAIDRRFRATSRQRHRHQRPAARGQRAAAAIAP